MAYSYFTGRWYFISLFLDRSKIGLSSIVLGEELAKEVENDRFHEWHAGLLGEAGTKHPR
jgi:hypothetical protein